MSENEKQLRTLLANNVGFDDIERWLEYARRHAFKPVKATKILHCPDCGAAPKAQTWGQYVYYSTLISLLECSHCGLVWANVRLDHDVIRNHFESAYKDDDYFVRSRRAIFRHMVDLIVDLCPRGGRVLDIGGARGHLMAQVVARRPDLTVVVNDISEAATNWVAENLGFAALTGGADELALHQEQYQVVVLSDVLYYEPNLPVLWSALSRLVCQEGSIVIRVPQKSGLIFVAQRWYRLTHTKAQQAVQDRIRFFNPEHIYIFRKHYLRSRLASIGFERIEFFPSPLLVSGSEQGLKSILFAIAQIVNKVTRRSVVLTPAMIVVGQRRTSR